MTQELLSAIIAEQVKSLKTPAIGRQYARLARQAQDGGWSFEDYLKELLDVEITARREHTAAQRLKEARFPDLKTLDQIEWDALEGISRHKILELARCEYLLHGDDVILAGPIGTGKTHLAMALGVEATRRRHRVAFYRAADLVRSLLEARQERVFGRLQARMLRVDLLIIDEFGFVPFQREGGELLFNLLSDRHGRKSTLITTNLAFSEWVQVLGCEKLTTALLDRIGFHSHILTTKGTSFRTHKRHTRRPTAASTPDAPAGMSPG